MAKRNERTVKKERKDPARTSGIFRIYMHPDEVWEKDYEALAERAEELAAYLKED